jgi:sulfur-oxidizing protein SoxY
MTLNRRSFLSLSAALGLLPLNQAWATEAEAKRVIDALVGSAFIKTGRVKLDIPPLVENGNLVSMKVSVESPMTEQDFVKAIHIIAEGNPLPNIISFYLDYRAGRAQIESRIRLAESQRVIALAQMNDGSFHQGFANTLVTLSACTEV